VAGRRGHRAYLDDASDDNYGETGVGVPDLDNAAAYAPIRVPVSPIFVAGTRVVLCVVLRRGHRVYLDDASVTTTATGVGVSDLAYRLDGRYAFPGCRTYRILGRLSDV